MNFLVVFKLFILFRNLPEKQNNTALVVCSPACAHTHTHKRMLFPQFLTISLGEVHCY